MKKVVGAIVAALLISCVAMTQTTTQSTTTTTTTTTRKSSSAKKGTTTGATVEALQAREQMLLDAYKDHKSDVFRKELGAEALMIDSSGPHNREEILTRIGSMDCAVNSATATDAKVINVDRDSALLYYTLKVDGKCGNNPLPGIAYASTLYNRRGGKWAPVFHQETLPAGRGM
jgi:hypothetical protein